MRNKTSKISLAKSDRAYMAMIYIILTLISIIILYPLIYITSSSFSSTGAVSSGSVWLFPVEPSLAGYIAIFKNNQVAVGYGNSIYYTVIGTLINVAITIMAAYPLSRKDFYGRGFIMAMFTFTMLFSGGLIPTYLLVKNLGMRDTRWAMIIPSAMSVFQVIIARSFFQSSIPIELQEAADIDGCNDFTFIRKIVLPLSAPIIAVLTLMYAVGNWNSYFSALIYLDSPKLFPLQIILRNILIQNTFDPAQIVDAKTMMAQQGMQQLLKYSLIIVASVPILILYPFIQKYFVKGMMIGSIKG